MNNRSKSCWGDEVPERPLDDGVEFDYSKEIYTVNKEKIYDESISPLMEQIIAICLEHKIAVIASFAISTDADDSLHVTTNLPDETGKNPEHHAAAYRALVKSGASPMMLRTDHADGSTTITAIVG